MSHPSYDELEAYGVPGSAAPEAATDREESVVQHLAECASCGELVDKLRRVDSELKRLQRLPAQNSESHPEMKSWLQLAAGLLPEDSALRLLKHAAQSQNCTQALEDAKSYLAVDPVAPSPGLKSSTEAWQHDVARLMALHTQKPARGHRRLLWKWALAGAVAAIVAVIGIFLFQYSGNGRLFRADRLIAQAYAGNRTLDMRFPEAQHAPVNQQRGDAGASRFTGLDSSTPFRRAVEVVTDQLKRHPEDSAWLVRRARIDLLDWRYKAALSALDQISSTASDNYDLLSTQAIAEFERGEVENRSEAFARAEDDLTRALKLRPNDPALLFNRALVYEKLMMYESARDDWQQVLKREADPGWRAEAQRHLSVLEEKKTPTSAK